MNGTVKAWQLVAYAAGVLVAVGVALAQLRMVCADVSDLKASDHKQDVALERITTVLQMMSEDIKDIKGALKVK